MRLGERGGQEGAEGQWRAVSVTLVGEEPLQGKMQSSLRCCPRTGRTTRWKGTRLGGRRVMDGDKLVGALVSSRQDAGDGE